METRAKLLFDGSRLISNYQRLQKALPTFKLAYAIKANSHENIIRILAEEGSCFETASFNEIAYLLSLNVPAERIIFSNPVKVPSSIDDALEKGVDIFTFDSIEELEKFHNKPNAKLVLRLEVPSVGAMWPLNKKFGCPEALWKPLFQRMQEKNYSLAGITYHVGSQCENINTWNEAMATVYQAIKLSHTYGLKPYLLNIGGGFPIELGRPIPMVEDIGSLLYTHLKTWESEGIHITHLFAEPGRFLVGSAGVLETTIVGITSRTECRWVFLNSGIFAGMLESIDGVKYPIASTGAGAVEEVMLCGPSCDSIDKLYKTNLPSPKDGDVIYFYGTGAYTSVYSCQFFNGFLGPEIKFLTAEEFAKLPSPKVY